MLQKIIDILHSSTIGDNSSSYHIKEYFLKKYSFFEHSLNTFWSDYLQYEHFI